MSFKSTRWRSNAPFTAMFALTLLLLIIGLYTDHGLMELNPVSSEKKSINSTSKNNIFSATHRKLLIIGREEEEKEKEKRANPNRIWSEKCSILDIVISQGATEPLPNGIPTYTVEIMNVCIAGCNISRIHVNCGWFSSARLINPRVFKRLQFDDCLVNDGKPLVYGRTLSFQYANTFRYPISVSSIAC